MSSMSAEQKIPYAARFVVMVPTYNSAVTISETLTALQKCSEFSKLSQVIVVDDFSSDGTCEEAERAWTGTVPLMIWRNAKNLGQFSSKNQALGKINEIADWTFILHADDVVKPNWLQLYFNAIENSDLSVASICSSYDNWWPESGLISPGEESPERCNELILGTKEAVDSTIERGCWWHISGCAIRNVHFKEIGDFKSTMPQSSDWEWSIRCLSKGYGIIYVPRTTMLYRQHDKSVSSSSFNRGQDLFEKLSLYQQLYNQTDISNLKRRQLIAALLWPMLRRSATRLIRRDFENCFRCLRLISHAAAAYLR